MNFVKKINILILSLNINKHFNKNLLNICYVNESRTLVDTKIQNITRKLIMPMEKPLKLITKKNQKIWLYRKKDHFDSANITFSMV